MAQQFIDFGSFPDDPDADAIRTAFQKTQNNFNQLFTQASSGSVQTISSPTGGGIDVSSPAGNVVLIANIACVQVHTSTLSVGIGANGLTDATLTSSSQVLWVDLPINISNVQSINLQPTTTLLSNAPAVRIQQTWNSASNTFVAFYTNITDTNSSSASKLIDLQVNAASKFSVNKDGDITANSISITAFSTGNISVGNGSFSGNLLVSGNITGGNLITSGNVSATGNVSGANLVTTGNASITGNVSAGNVSATLLTGTLTTNAQPNITSVGTLTSLSVTGNANVGNIGATFGVFTNVSGNGSSLSSITGANVTGQVGNALVAGTVYTAAQPNITSVGTLTSLTVTGNIGAGNVNAPTFGDHNGTVGATTANTGAFTTISATGQITSTLASGTAPFVVTSTTQVANLSVATAGSATTAGTVTTNAQPNITSVGTLTSLSVSGNITGANLQGSLANGNSNINIPSANGNINLSAVGNANIVVVTGTGANVTGTLNVTGNTTAGNVILSGATSGVSLGGSFGTRGQTLKSDGNSNAIWSTQFYYGNNPPNFSDLNYGDIFFYIDAPNNFQRLYMWVTDGSSDYFYDFLPPSF